jgi:hypothetical protein
MASAMAIGSEVIGECVEGIRVEVGGKVLRMVLVCPGFFDWVLSVLMAMVVRLRRAQGCQVLVAD